MSIGFVAELVTAHLSREMQAYSIAERVNEPEIRAATVREWESGSNDP
jgi:hypothetical protein